MVGVQSVCLRLPAPHLEWDEEAPPWRMIPAEAKPKRTPWKIVNLGQTERVASPKGKMPVRTRRLAGKARMRQDQGKPQFRRTTSGIIPPTPPEVVAMPVALPPRKYSRRPEGACASSLQTD